MRQQILDFINEHEGVTLADLQLSIEGFEGDQGLTLPDLAGLNIYLWQGISAEACDAITSLIDDGEVVLRLINPDAYWHAGLVPNCEVAYEQKYYEKSAWLPVALLSPLSFEAGLMEHGEENFAENEAEYCLDYLEKFIHENRNVEGVLPDGPWAQVCMDLENICESHGEMISKATMARKNQVFVWINSKCKPKLLADEIKEEEDIRDLMDAFSSMSGEQLKKYYENMDVDDEQ